MFEYEFMRKAFVAGAMLSIVIPCIGVVVVLKRLSMIGDALSHASLAGIAGGLAAGINPVAGAVVTGMLSALCIEALRKKFPKYAEIAVAVVMAVGLGLAGVLSGFAPGASSFSAFLFGSIVSISSLELALVTVTCVLVFAAFVALYDALFLIALDERQARLSGIPVGAVNVIFTLLTAAAIAVASRTVGTLVASSLMVIPVACAMQSAKSYRQTVILSIIHSAAFMLGGIAISYYTGFKPGGTIALLGAATLCAELAITSAIK